MLSLEAGSLAVKWRKLPDQSTDQTLTGLTMLQEIKNFYARCALAYTWCIYFIIRGVGRGLKYNRPIIMYNHAIHAKTLANYPDLFYWNVGRVLPKNPPVPDAHREWRTR